MYSKFVINIDANQPLDIVAELRKQIQALADSANETAIRQEGAICENLTADASSLNIIASILHRAEVGIREELSIRKEIAKIL